MDDGESSSARVAAVKREIKGNRNVRNVTRRNLRDCFLRFHTQAKAPNIASMKERSCIELSSIDCCGTFVTVSLRQRDA
jgi:hypothetical protein